MRDYLLPAAYVNLYGLGLIICLTETCLRNVAIGFSLISLACLFVYLHWRLSQPKH